MPPSSTPLSSPSLFPSSFPSSPSTSSFSHFHPLVSKPSNHIQGPNHWATTHPSAWRTRSFIQHSPPPTLSQVPEKGQSRAKVKVANGTPPCSPHTRHEKSIIYLLTIGRKKRAISLYLAIRRVRIKQRGIYFLVGGGRRHFSYVRGPNALTDKKL